MKARIKATNEIVEVLFAEVYASGEYKAFYLNIPKPLNKFKPDEIELIDDYMIDYEKKYKNLVEAVKVLQEAWHDVSKEPDNKTELKDFPSFDEAQGTPLLIKKDKPNPAWSEDDELNFRRALWYINYYQTHEADTKEAKECFDFLESLKDRVQPNQEWNNEDKEHIESILKRLDGMCKKGATFTKTCFAVNQDMDWLKNLKDRVQPQPKKEVDIEKKKREWIEQLCK